MGVLDTAAVLYVWDQCFLSGWSSDIIDNVCLVLLQLIAHRLMGTHDFTSLKHVRAIYISSHSWYTGLVLV